MTLLRYFTKESMELIDVLPLDRVDRAKILMTEAAKAASYTLCSHEIFMAHIISQYWYMTRIQWTSLFSGCVKWL